MRSTDPATGRLTVWAGRSRRAALVALLATNAVPLIGVLGFGWSVQTLLVLYWLESAVVGAFNVPKRRRAHGVGALVVMVVVKTVLDLRAHLREHASDDRPSAERQRPAPE
jgi:hypothetical protein